MLFITTYFDLYISSHNRFKNARLSAGYSQEDVCVRSGFISRTSLGNYETGYEYPGNKVLYFLPKLYGTSLDYLFCEDLYPTHDEFVKDVLFLNEESIQILKSIPNRKFKNRAINKYLNQLIKEELKNGDSRKTW